MMNKKLAISMSAAVLTGCGGGTPDLTPSAVAEATKILESAKIPVASAYASNNNTFPTTGNPPISVGRPANAKYVTVVHYFAVSKYGPASVVVTLGGTGNPNVDGKFLGMFGVGHTDGTVTWTCGTAAAATSTAPAAVRTMWAYLPDYCQN